MKEIISTLWKKIRHLSVFSESPKSLLRNRRVHEAAIILFVIMFTVFILLSVIVYLLPVTWIDRHFSAEVQEERHPILDALMKAISFFGNTYVVAIEILIAAGACFQWGYRREALFVLLTSIGSLVTYLIKLLIRRPRPTDDFVHILQGANHASFPSGHVTHYVVFFGFLFVIMFSMSRINIYLRICIALFCLGLIITIPVSRVYLGVHWLTDVTGGFIIGLIILAILLYFYFRNRKSEENGGKPLSSDQ